MVLSKPMKTLDVPSLVPDMTEARFKPASYLLVLAGTGIVVASQVLHHTDRSTNFGTFPVLTAPIRLIYSCRRDDVLLASDLMNWCKDGKLSHLSLLVTEIQTGDAVPFPDVAPADLSNLESLDNASLFNSRLSQELLERELALCTKPVRIVVSGPAT